MDKESMKRKMSDKELAFWGRYGEYLLKYRVEPRCYFPRDGKLSIVTLGLERTRSGMSGGRRSSFMV